MTAPRDSTTAIQNPKDKIQHSPLWGGAALLLALAGQELLDRRAPGGAAAGWIVLLGAALLAARAFGRSRALALSPFAAQAAATARPGRRAAALLALGLLCGAAAVPGLVALATPDWQAAPHLDWPWLLWLAGIALFAVGAADLSPNPSPARGGEPAILSPNPSPARGGEPANLSAARRGAPANLSPSPSPARGGETDDLSPPSRTGKGGRGVRSVAAAWPWLLIVGAAAVVRLWDLNGVPRGFWADEAIAGLQAEQILRQGIRPLFIGGLNGEPAFYLYGIAGLIKLLGPTVVAVRLLMALAGTAAVAALGWLVAPVYGRRTALAAAALLAAMTWQINFSRIGFNAIWSLPVDLLAAGCLVRALAGGRLGWYAGAGLLGGLGFQLYYISRAWLGLLGLLVAYRLLTERGLWRRARGGLLLLAFGLALGAAPVLVYAAVQPGDYFARAAAVSALPALQQAGSLAPLFDNLLTHLRMWNETGDPQGRHNLPGVRMLDLLTAALLPCGLALALVAAWTRRRGRVLAWPYLFAATGLVVLLAGGVFSAPDESPQALRTLGDTSLVALLAALPVVALWEALDGASARRGAARVRRGAARHWRPGAVVAAALLAAVFAANVRRYFVLQEPNPAVYKQFSTAARLVAEMAAVAGPGTDDFVAQGLYEQATIQYLAGGPIGTPFTDLAETPLPPGAPGRPALLFLYNRDPGALDWLAHLYPHATIDSPSGPGGGNALLFAVHIPAADRAAPYHVALTLIGADGRRVATAETGGVALDWSRVLSAGLTLPAQATWEGTLRPPASGVYHISVAQTGGVAHAVRLELAGRRIDPAGADLSLIAGRYPFTLTASVRAAQGGTQLRWAGPAATGVPPAVAQVITPDVLLAPELGSAGLTARYRNGAQPDAPVALVREEPAPSWFFFYTPFGLTTPFVGEWQGTLRAPRAGEYTFEADIGGTPGLWLDGRALPWTPAGQSELDVPLYRATARLAAGAHTFRFRDQAPGWREPCFLFWTPPGGTQALIPAAAFAPDLWGPW